MSAYDEIIRTVREQERLLAPIRDFEKLYGHDFRRVAEAEELRNDSFKQRSLNYPVHIRKQLNRCNPNLIE